ncbi:MAG: flagellar biosynthesis protein FlhF [Gammaproteobacteria bacterium]|nr:flagellar biosynthesis protein FlhF [Gammaproteobacteria bacterium]NNF60042.1 flagellar biosynthesis protein FlhF [Gammaproteobacteria bacterium]NNM19973.1 flagellar biosynthesis protein FlhF [Gammaproteobacteria bacterium]
MKIKRYVAPDMRRAMRQVRDKQGPDAVILSSRRTTEGVEVIAAIDYDASQHPLQPLPQTERPAPAVQEQQQTGDMAFGGAMQTWSDDTGLDSMKQEVASLRRLLESQLASLAWNDTARRNPVRAAVVRELVSLGLTQTLAEQLAAEVGSNDMETAIVEVMSLLRDRLPVLEEEIITTPGAVALVGPTGVGKTTTIAKLAARYALRHGTDGLALLTTDSFRIGAQEQLMTFGRILGVPVQLVRDSAEMATALNDLADKQLVLIDSSGMSQRDRRINDELATIRRNGENIRVLLALSCNAQTAVLDETVRAFSHLRPTACVLTKTDEAASLGGAISALLRHDLPLAYVTDGQRVPEDLHWASSRRFSLVEKALELRNAETLQHEAVANA